MGRRRFRVGYDILKHYAMKKTTFLSWLVMPAAILWTCSCTTEEGKRNGRKEAAISVNLLAESNEEVKARLIFWREDDYHALDQNQAIPYCVSLPDSPIDNYKYNSSSSDPVTSYNTGVPYPNTYEKLHVTGYAPQEMLPEGGSAEDVLAGDYRMVPLKGNSYDYTGGKSDILACSGQKTGSEDQPFDATDNGESTNMVFKHAGSRLIFKVRRDSVSTYGRMQFRNVKIQLPDAYAPQALQWQGDNYLLTGSGNDYTTYNQGLNTRTYANSIRVIDTIQLDTLYVATHNADKTPHGGTIYLRVTAERSNANFREGSYIDNAQWDIPIQLKHGQDNVSALQAGYSYEITIIFNLDSFLIEAEEEDWEDHLVVDVQIINDQK